MIIFKDHPSVLRSIVDGQPFPRLKFADALNLLANKSQRVTGGRLSKQNEAFLVAICSICANRVSQGTICLSVHLGGVPQFTSFHHSFSIGAETILHVALSRWENSYVLSPFFTERALQKLCLDRIVRSSLPWCVRASWWVHT